MRFGSFERLLHLDLTKAEQCEQIKTLASYCIRQCYPELLRDDTQCKMKPPEAPTESAADGEDCQAEVAGAPQKGQSSIFRAFFAAVRVLSVLLQ